jgi:glucose-1-phosphate thymidylyltransferase
MYLQESKLKAELLGGGFCWFDTGTFESELDAAMTIKSIQTNRDVVIACLEQIGYDKGWLSEDDLAKRATLLSKNTYGKYLTKTLERGRK